MRRREGERLGVFVEHEMSQAAFLRMDPEHKLIVQRYSIPLPTRRKGFVRFKMTRNWYRLAFPTLKDLC